MEARRIGVKGPVFKETVREGSSFAARADDNERFATEARTRWDLHRLDYLVSKVPYQFGALACIPAVTKHDSQTRAYAQNLPQRVGNQVVRGAVLQLEDA